MKGHQKWMKNAGGQRYLTLKDILPASPGLRVLFVAKTPAPGSVEIGHYFQGEQGSDFWKKLKEYDLLPQKKGFEDDSLLELGYGLTDIVKAPHRPGHEPYAQEYREGANRILNLIQTHRPKVVVFVYKKVLDKIIRFQFRIEKRSEYGFNSNLEKHFNSRVFCLSAFWNAMHYCARPPCDARA